MMFLNSISDVVTTYGYYAVFFLMLIGMIGVLPVPEESTLIFIGILITKGDLNLIWCLPLAFLGTISGMTVDYFLGYKFGQTFVTRFGKYVGLKQERYVRLQGWFLKYGRWMLAIGYFIPGLRQVTAYFAGISQHSYKNFAWSAYIGAAIWSSTFILLGFFTGDAISAWVSDYAQYIPWIVAAIGILLVCYWMMKKMHLFRRLLKLILVFIKRFRLLENK